MKKGLLLISALAMTLLANATILDIAPNSPKSSDNIRREIRDHIYSGDTLRLATGTYTESESVAANKNVVIIAADGATPVVRLATGAYISVSNNANVVIKGIKFDGATNGTNYAVRFGDASSTNIRIEDCEFYGFTKNIITSSEGYHADLLVINNCHFHNNIGRACVYLPACTAENQQICSVVKITNSTFNNNDASGDWVSVVDIRSNSLAATDDMEVLVDHCTFYNNLTKNHDYADVATRTINKTTVSNCIFVNGSAQADIVNGPQNARRATFLYAGTVENSLTYNLLEDADNDGHTWMTTRKNTFTADPLFTDSAQGNFSFVNNNWVTKNLSPACGAATDGIDLGDPRWHTTIPVLPSVDFASAYDLVGSAAQLTGEIEINSNNIAYKGSSAPGIASWRLNVTQACAVKVDVNMADGSDSGCKLELVVFDEKGNKVDAVLAEYVEDDTDFSVLGTLYFPKAGKYTIRLNNGTGWSSAKIETITLTYAGGAVQNLPCTTAINEAWFGNGGTRADGTITFSSWSNDNSWVKWKAATSDDIFCNVTLRINTTNAHHFAVDIYEDGKEEAIATLSEKYSETTGDALDIDLGRVHIAADKNLIIKVTNPVSGSKAKVISLKFEEVVIPTIAIAGTLNPADAMLSERAWVDTEGALDSLLFTARGDEGYNSSQWAKWKISAANHGYYKFTLNAYTGTPAKAQQYILTVLSNDESEIIATKTTAWNNSTNEYTDNVCAELAPGNYIVKVENPEWGSRGRVMNIVATYDGGAFTEIPTNSLLGNEAMLHATKLTRDANNNIKYDDNETPLDEYVIWNIHVTDPDEMVVTLNVVEEGHQFSMELYKAGIRLDSIGEPVANWNANIELSSHLTFPEAGNYQLKLLNNQQYSGGVLHSITFAPYVAPEPIVIDENATTNGIWADYYDTNEAIDLSIIRTLKGGMYNTICLPFELGSENSMNNAFGAGYELLKLTEASLEGGVLNLIFEQKKTLEYGVPYLIKPVADVVDPSFTGRKIKTTTASVYTRGVVDFVGTFTMDEIPASESNLFVGPNNTLYFPTGNTPIKGMRAWFRVNVPSANQVVSHARIVTQGQTVTEIDLVNEQNNGIIKTIENGQLVIIKNGVRYNATGVMMK